MSARNPWLRPAGAEGFIPVAVLWDRFCALYGSRWRELFSEDSARFAWEQEAAAVLYGRGIGYKVVKPALDRLRSSIKADSVPLSIVQFADLCLPDFDFEAAFKEAQQQAPLVSLGLAVWSDKAVYWAARDFGMDKIGKATWARAKGDWTRFLADRLASCPAIPVVQKPNYTKGNAQVAANAIDNLHQILGMKRAA